MTTQVSKKIESHDLAWEKIRSGARLDRGYIFMNFFATVLACYGLFANNPAVVIGSMVVALLFGPIMGVALALVEGDFGRLIYSIITEFVGIGTVYGVATILAFVHKDMPISSEILSRTAPNLIDLIVALAGGAAGAYAIIIPGLGLSMIGVAIATALVPPLASSAILMMHGEYTLAGGAFLLAFTNMVAIQIASFIVILFFKYPKMSLRPFVLLQVILRNLISVGILAGLGFFLFAQFCDVVNSESYKFKVRAIIQKALEKFDGDYLIRLDLEKKRDLLIIRAVVEGPRLLTPEEILEVESKLPLPPKKYPVDFRVRFVHTVVTSSHGALYASSDD